jgi:hypothetical protein
MPIALYAPAPAAPVFEEPVAAPPASPPAAIPSTAAPAPAAAFPRDEDFGFDFGDMEPAPRVAESFGVGGRPAGFAPEEPVAETEEDLWSEVSLRGQGADVLEKPPAAAADAWPGPVEVLEEDAEQNAGEVVFEEAASVRVLELGTMALPEEEYRATPVSAPVPPSVPAPAAAVDPAEIERLVAERLEDVVRQVLSPLISELAKKKLEEIAWEVIPDLAEAMIRAEIERVRQATSTG